MLYLWKWEMDWATNVQTSSGQSHLEDFTLSLMSNLNQTLIIIFVMNQLEFAD